MKREKSGEDNIGQKVLNTILIFQLNSILCEIIFSDSIIEVNHAS